MIKKIFENAIIVPILLVALGSFGFTHDILTDVSAIAIFIGLITWLWFNPRMDAVGRKDKVMFNNIVAIILSTAPLNLTWGAFCLIAFLIFNCFHEVDFVNSLSPSQRREYYAKREQAFKEQQEREERARQRERERFAQQAEQDRQRDEYVMTHNEFGRPLNPKLPQNAKMLQIHVKYKNGTSGIWQKIGIEHEVRAMLEADPRIETFDLGLLSPMDNGRYPEY